MKRFPPHYLLAGCLASAIAIANLAMPKSAIAQPAEPTDLSYSFYGRSIPLTLREDVIAVDLKQTDNTRDRSAEAPYLKLQRALQGGTRGGDAPLQVKVQPLSQGYAVVSFPSGSRSTPRDVQQRVQGLPYVNGTVPVLSRQGQQETLLLPNEIVVSFDGNDQDRQAMQATLKRYGAEIIRPVAFSKNQVVVRATHVEGVQVLRVAQQLNRAQGIRSATPNFIQSVQYLPGDAFAPPSEEPPADSQLKLQPVERRLFNHNSAALFATQRVLDESSVRIDLRYLPNL
jgi:serine protease